jgi:hypothetical protein
MDEKTKGIVDVVENVHFKPIHLTATIREDTGNEVVPGDVLFVEQAAVHADRLSNNMRLFTPSCLQGSISDWTKDYPKPVLVNHDVYTDPLGRVVAAILEEEDGKPYHKLVMGIIDAGAIQKVLDGRYNTGSVGGKAIHVSCSICGKDIIVDSAVSDSCKHVPGEVYKGKMAHMIYHQVRWVEYSFVNVPADTKSRKLAARFAQSDLAESVQEELYIAPRYYFIPNKEERVLAFSEGESLTIDVSEDSPDGEIYLTFMEAAERLWDEARLEIAVDSAHPEAMEVIKGVPKTPSEGQSVTDEDIEQICSDVRDMLMGKAKPALTDISSKDPSEEAWNTAYINSLPDAAFALVKRPVKDKAKDRALPHHSKGVKSASENGSVDKAHLRNALARANQVQGFSTEAKARAAAHLKKHASALGIGEDEVEDLLERGEEAFAEYLEKEDIVLTTEKEEPMDNAGIEEVAGEAQEGETSTQDAEEPTPEEIEGEEGQVEEEIVPGEEAADTEEEEAVEEGEQEEVPETNSEEPAETEDSTESQEDREEEETPQEEEDSDGDTADFGTQELMNELHALREQNASLRQEIHFFIAERVVEEMCQRKMVKEEDWSDTLEEHLKRSTISLRDKLNDLLKEDPKVTLVSAPDLGAQAAPIESNEPVDETPEEDKQEEDAFADVPPDMRDVYKGMMRPRTYGDYLRLDKTQR